MNKKILKIRPKGEKTVGQISSELLEKNPSKGVLVVDQANAMLGDVPKNVVECINAHRKIFPKDFYVVVLTKVEHLMQNVIRFYYLGRLTCPTPNFDQAVYKYHRDKEQIDFLWSIPTRSVCEELIENKENMPPEEWDLLKMVLDFKDGTLFKKAKELNGEKLDSGLLERKVNG